MNIVVRRALSATVVALSVLVVTVGSNVSSTTGPEPAAAVDAWGADLGRAQQASLKAKVEHRVVWDRFERGQKGIHLRSAHRDGADERAIYDLGRGFTLSLTMDSLGRRVAFAPCCRDDLPQLVVVPVAGGKEREPLARHPELAAVGGIGWSPNGRRLAFEAIAVHGEQREKAIWTVRLDGSGLKRVLTLPDPPEYLQTVINDALAWTPNGILYSDGEDLRSVRAGRSELVLPHVSSVRLSGDRKHIIVERRRRSGAFSIWIANPDGRRAEKLVAKGEPGRTTTYYDVTPNYDASEMLAIRNLANADGSPSDVVTWPRDDSPRSETPLTYVGSNYVVTWN